MSIRLKQIRRGSLTIVFFCCSALASGQILQTERFETPMRRGETIDNYAVISAKAEGLIIYNLLTQNGKSFLYVSRLDTMLAEVWKGTIDMQDNYIPRKAVVHDGSLYVLCKSSSKSDFLLIVVILATKNFSKHIIRNFIPFIPSDFIALGKAVMIGGYFNYRPLVLHYSITKDQSRVLPGFFNDQGELLQLKISENNIVDIIVSSRNTERKRSLWLRNYDVDGNLIKTTYIEPEPDKNLIFGRSIEAGGEGQVVAGVYGRSTQYARGIFIAYINPYGEYTISYYNFGDLKNFFSYMKAPREKRVHARIQRRRIKGKKIKFNYRFLVHELVPIGDEFVLLGEAFYPVYKSINNTPQFIGGPPIISRGQNRSDFIFDGYQYTHAIVIGLSKTGKLLWDNSFEINDVRTFTLDQEVKIQPKDNRINLLYLHNNLLRSKIIQGDQVLEGKAIEPIKTKFEFDVATPETDSKNRLEYWYNDRFYAFGAQRITNTHQAGIPLSRNVFYINKIVNK